MVRIELLSEKNFNEHSLDSYERKQDVKRVYRRDKSEYVLVDMPYIEDWSLEKKQQVARDISSDEYISYIALDDDKVVGFIGLEKQLKNDCMILDIIQVSLAYRGNGIGKKLFNIAKQEAKKAGAKALYISACSSEETIAFYKAMGAELTNSPIREIADDEPYDLQMVCSVEAAN
ncbi:MAG: GNAT family N-acetyltransferase [Oscillospiraceae bacterium]|nr:GNAT family N-acetyltransferase [Oscillospiraceae bacterium]